MTVGERGPGTEAEPRKASVARKKATALPRPYKIPLRVPARRRDPAIAGIDEEIFYQKRRYNDALEAARHYRSASNLPNREAFYDFHAVSMKFMRIEIARLLRIRRDLSRQP
jgi:hypothetical protein